MTMDELREQYPDMVAEIEANARASAENNAASNAAAAERQRLAAIDEVASLFSDELVRDAKYGENPCTAQELAYRAAMAAARQGLAFLNGLQEDSAESGANTVTVATAPQEGSGEDRPMTNEDRMAAGEAMAKKLFEKN